MARGNPVSRRRGVQILELLLVTPIFLLVVVAAIEYVVILTGVATVTQAAGVGAREAGKVVHPSEVPDRPEIVAAAVNAVLATNGIHITQSEPGSGKVIVIEDGGGGSPEEYGDPDVNPTLLVPPPAAGEVRVTVHVSFGATKTNGTTKVVGPFNVFGYTMNGKSFQASCSAQKE